MFEMLQLEETINVSSTGSQDRCRSGQKAENVKSGAHLCLSPEVVLVGFSNFSHGVGLLVNRALREANHQMLHLRRNSSEMHRLNLRAVVRIIHVYAQTNQCPLQYSLGS